VTSLKKTLKCNFCVFTVTAIGSKADGKMIDHMFNHQKEYVEVVQYNTAIEKQILELKSKLREGWTEV
jgi:hypothetical protein